VPIETEWTRLGGAAFDEHRNQVPVPQRAFDQGYLSPDGEVYCGVGLSDGGVVISDLYDPIRDDEGGRYLGSSTVDDDRTLAVPDVVLDHWDERYGGDAVVGGDELVFVTTPALAERDQLRVVPAVWADEVLGEAD
jgi:hypothetical protein